MIDIFIHIFAVNYDEQRVAKKRVGLPMAGGDSWQSGEIPSNKHQTRAADSCLSNNSCEQAVKIQTIESFVGIQEAVKHQAVGLGFGMGASPNWNV